MTLKFKGKTKDIYQNEDGTITLKFKDDVTGKDGVFDPGANEVGLSIEGIGNLGLQVTRYFFENLKGIPTHYIASDLTDNTMNVKDCIAFGKGLEVICRLKAGGSFIRRYGAYINDGEDLDYFVEFTIKDDERNDPPISKEGLIALGILSEEEFTTLVDLTQNITKQVKDLLNQKELTLHDIKYEFGKHNNEILLIDEISAGSMRASHNGEIIDPIELSKLILNQK